MRVYVGRIISMLLAILGVGLLIYPTASSWTHQYHQSTLIDTFHEKTLNVVPVAVEQLEAARKYNKAIRSGARLAPNTNVPLSDVKATEDALGLWEYDKILNLSGTGLMGRIIVPKADVDLPIYHGTTEATLLKGAGHLQGTSLPVGGKGTRTVITAHRGLADATMFTYLDRVEIGDIFTLNIFDEVYSYKVIETKVVAPEESEAVLADPEQDLATLITCTPLGINSHRILVTGVRVLPTPIEEVKIASESSRLPHFPWFAVYTGAFLLFALGVIIHSTRAIILLKREAKNFDALNAQTDSQTTEAATPETTGNGTPTQPQQ